jgi:hypothetical protein
VALRGAFSIRNFVHAKAFLDVSKYLLFEAPATEHETVRVRDYATISEFLPSGQLHARVNSENWEDLLADT